MRFIKLILVLMLAWNLQAQSLREKVNQGNEAYFDEAFEQALTFYNDALLDDPLNEDALFNKGDALYKLKKYDEAVETFQKLLGSEDLGLSARAHYNIGNCQFRQEKLQESIESYKRALEIIPDDFDTKYNLELARAKLKEQSEKQPQQQDQNQQQKKVEPSEYAKELKKRAEEMVSKQLYDDALTLMQNGLKRDETVNAFQDFITRIEDVVKIVSNNE